MKRKIGRLCMVLGAVLILCAAGLLGYNRWDAARAEKASQEVLGVHNLILVIQEI